MILKEVVSIVQGRILCGAEREEESVEYGFASDLMSDVLTLRDHDFLLVTGLANVQLVRTAEMSDVSYILLCRGKSASEDMIELARENGMMIIESPMSLFKCSGLLFQAGLKPIF